MTRRTSAFTLIEVLVVVAIIALLISILLPSLSQARNQAKRSVCASQLHQVGTAIQLYSADQRGWIPPLFTGGASNPGIPVTSFGNGIESGGPGLLVKKPVGYGTTAYLPSPDVFFCPSDSILSANRVPNQWAPLADMRPYPNDPGVRFRANLHTSYWYLYVDPTGRDSGDVTNNRVGFYENFSRAHMDRIKLVKGAGMGNKHKSVALMSDLGMLGLWSYSYPLTHPTGWNVLKIDASVTWAPRVVMDKDFNPFLDHWMQMMERFDRR